MSSALAANARVDMNIYSQRKSSTNKGGWRSAIFIIFVEVAERFAYYGVAGNLITYLTSMLHQPTATAAKNVNVWQGVSAIFPLLGGFLADSYTGRFKTILISSIVYLLGLVLLTTTVTAVPLGHQEALFFISLYILSIGEGGHKPCVQTFAADQFDDDLPEEKAAKSSFFNWWYLGIVCGATAAVLVVIYVQDYVSWGIGFGMLAAAVAIALVIFLIGTATYRQQPPIGSPFTRVARVMVAAMRKRHMTKRLDGRGICYYEDDDASHKLSRTSQFRFLDNAMIIDEIDARSEKRDKWRLCSVNQVEEVKLLLRLIPIWFCCSMYAVVNAQHGTYFTKQGNTMIRSIGSSKFHVAAASLQVITGLTILIAVLIYDQVLVPLARNITGYPSGITVLQRIGIGLFSSIIIMVVAALVETRRISVAREHALMDATNSTVPMAIWWLIPQYMLCGISDVFTYVGLQELFYDQVPEEMRSMGAAACISVVGLGSFMSSAIISIIQEISRRSGDKWLINNLNRAHLNYFYWVLAGLSFLNLCVYLCVAKIFVYKKFEVNDAMKEKEVVLESL